VQHSCGQRRTIERHSRRGSRRSAARFLKMTTSFGSQWCALTASAGGFIRRCCTTWTIRALAATAAGASDHSDRAAYSNCCTLNVITASSEDRRPVKVRPLQALLPQTCVRGSRKRDAMRSPIRQKAMSLLTSARRRSGGRTKTPTDHRNQILPAERVDESPQRGLCQSPARRICSCRFSSRS
jgi:hypothetical protein